MTIKKITAVITAMFLIFLSFPKSSIAADTEIFLNLLSSPTSGIGYSFASGILTITVNGAYLITTEGTIVTDRTIKIDSGVVANITLNNVNIDDSAGTKCAFDMSGATVLLTLLGENTLESGDDHAGLEVPTGSSLTVSGTSTGKLTAKGGCSSAGIGGATATDAGNIHISGGDIIAIGESDISDLAFGGGAGIGGGGSNSSSGNGGSGGVIIIDGGNIDATGGCAAAGIGGGCVQYGHSGGTSGAITISGGVVKSAGSEGGAGIGGGWYGGCDSITITGGEVTAIGSGGEHPTRGECGGAGIGGGTLNHNIGIISISGGIISSTGSDNAAGIGSGHVYDAITTGNVNISGGTITATGGKGGAGIGSGLRGTVNVTISNGDITAQGALGGCGIGGGLEGAGGTITISGGTISAIGSGGEHPTRGDVYGAGIGGGKNHSAGTISIIGGYVVATGQHGSAGIGGDGGTLTITGGTIVASGSINPDWIYYASTEIFGAGIGGSVDGNGLDISISGSKTMVSATGMHDIGSGYGSSVQGTLQVYGGATLVSVGSGLFSSLSFSNCTITGDGAVLKDMKGTYDASGKRIILAAMIDSSKIVDVRYTGTAFTPALSVTNWTATLTENVDYTVSYSNNTNPGTASVTVSGIGDYSGTVLIHFRINNIDTETKTNPKNPLSTSTTASVPPSPIFQILTDNQSGITLSGWCIPGTAFVVSDLSAIDQNRLLGTYLQQNKNKLLYCKSITLTNSISGTITLVVPIDPKYNGQSVQMICDGEPIRAISAIAENGNAVFSTNIITSFAVIINDNQTPLDHTQENSFSIWIIILFIGLLTVGGIILLIKQKIC